MFNLKKLIIPIIVLFFIIYVSGNVRAQEPLGISLSPPMFELTSNPGDSLKNTIKLYNINDYALEIKTDIRKFVAEGEEGAVSLLEEDGNSIVSWITLANSDFIIDANSTKEIEFLINVPTNAEPGGHFGALVFRARNVNEPGVKGSGISVAQEIASLVLLKVSGDIKENVNIESFSTDKNFYEYGPVNFDIRVKNNGNVHQKMSGNIVITNILGREVKNISITPKNVLPDAVRKIDAKWDRKYLFGKYTATAVLKYGTNEKYDVVSVTSVTGLPYKYAAIILSVILLIGYGIYRARKRLTKAIQVLFKK